MIYYFLIHNVLYAVFENPLYCYCMNSIQYSTFLSNCYLQNQKTTVLGMHVFTLSFFFKIKTKRILWGNPGSFSLKITVIHLNQLFLFTFAHAPVLSRDHGLVRVPVLVDDHQPSVHSNDNNGGTMDGAKQGLGRLLAQRCRQKRKQCMGWKLFVPRASKLTH